MLQDLLADRYRDEQGLDKRALVKLIRLYFLRNQNLYLYAHVQSIGLAQTDRAHATVLVAMAGVPISAPQEAAAVHADLYHFEIDLLRENKSWLVQKAAWRPAEASELLSP